MLPIDSGTSGRSAEAVRGHATPEDAGSGPAARSTSDAPGLLIRALRGSLDVTVPSTYWRNR